jgi:hypothetical protein
MLAPMRQIHYGRGLPTITEHNSAREIVEFDVPEGALGQHGVSQLNLVCEYSRETRQRFPRDVLV